MRGWSLRTKILAASAGTLLVMIGATLAYVRWQANGFVAERIAADLEGSTTIIAGIEAERLGALQLTAQVLASFPQFRALLENTDAATIRDFLADYQRRTGRADLLVALAPDGQTLARTDAITAVALAGAQERWIAPLRAGQPSRGQLVTDTGVYHAAAEVAEAGGVVFGVLLAGARLDDAFAQRLRNATNEEVIILSTTGPLGSTLPAGEVPWKNLRDWADQAGPAKGQRSVTIRGEEYAVHASPGSDPSVLYLTLQSRDRALAPYRRIQGGLLALGLVVIGLGVGASAVLARTVTAPVARLVEGTEQVAKGNFSVTVDVATGDELGVLAASFNSMTRGLRERADMQKFMSQSTMEMIQSAAKTSSGERKRLTILFSDIRGFSRFAEERPPEVAVEWLNQCLGMQADLVRKHNGDVDKYVGDAVFALFDGEDMAFDAVRCAVEIQRQMEQLPAPDGEPLELGIGIVTGEVLLGSIGSRDRLDYTAIGNQVNLCSRLCSMAGPREILIADSTYSLVRDLVSAEHLQSVAIRGLANPADVYRMTISRSAKPA